MSKFQLKPKVNSLRKSGKTIREIQKITGLSKSTLLIWCRDVVFTPDEKFAFEEEMKSAGRHGRLKGAQANKNKKIVAQNGAKDLAKKIVGRLSKRDKLIAGIALYWAEGSKAATTTGFVFVNSDPIMVRFMYEWLVDEIKIPKDEIIAQISINEIHRERIGSVLNFWSDLLDLAPGSFLKPFFAKSVQKKVYENHDTHYGVLRLSVKRSTLLKYKVLGLIEVLKAGVAQVVRANAS